MAIKNNYHFSFPSYKELLGDAIKSVVKIVDARTVYSFLFFIFGLRLMSKRKYSAIQILHI